MSNGREAQDMKEDVMNKSCYTIEQLFLVQLAKNMTNVITHPTGITAVAGDSTTLHLR